ncbi:hypothetical protein DL96DRAFT_1786822 [Flagelloscypha sp. PMI_526]|nr:hypothetical protein DL96DRAFT_1786822 [Flagelloscypha sp. PMI_526]
MATHTSLPALDNTVGAIEIGFEFRILLLGVTTVQAYIYFRQFAKDPIIMKLLVAVAWLLDLAHTMLACHALYLLTVTWWGQPAKLLEPPPVYAIFVGSLLRIQALSALKKLDPLSDTYSYVLTYWATAKAMVVPTLYEFVHDYGWAFKTNFIGDAVVDTFTALALCYFLNKSKKDALKSTSYLVERLQVYTIQTGLLTSIVAILAAVTFQVMEDNGIWMGIYGTLPGWFCNAMLAALNSRRRLREATDTPLDLDTVNSPPVEIANHGKSQLQFVVPRKGMPSTQSGQTATGSADTRLSF